MISKLNIFILIGLLIGGCGSVDKSSIENLHDGKILKLGHAGLGFKSFINPFNPYPPNGRTAIAKALEYGADGVEVDLQMTKDSVLVLFHDESLDESTNLIGCIQDLTWSEIEEGEYQIGAFFDLFQNDRILRLDSMISWFSELESFPYIHFDIRTFNRCNEVDPYANNESIGQNLIQLLDSYNVPNEKVLLISTSDKFLLILGSSENTYPLSFEETLDFEKGLQKLDKLGINSLTIKPALLDKEKVIRAHTLGIEIITFGAKSRQGTANLINLHPDVIHSNNIEAMVDFLD